MNIALHLFRPQAFDHLGITQRRQGAGIQDLRLTAGEQRGTVYPGQQTHPAGNRTHFIQGTAVRTDLVYRNGAADDFLNQFLGNIRYIRAVFRIFFQEYFGDLFLDFIYIFFPFQFIGIHQSGF